MSGGRWFRCEEMAWDLLVEAMRSTGEPLSVSVASMDLRRHDHAPMSERQYARRWGWHHSRVRRLITSRSWVDPYRKPDAEAAKQQRSRGEAEAKQERSTAPTSNADNTPQGEAAAKQERSRSEAAVKHRNNNTLISISNKTCSNRTTDQDTDRDGLTTAERAGLDWHAALALWQKHKPKGPRMTKSRGAGRLLSARLKDQGFEAVRDVLVWGLTSEDRQAQWLRANGYCRVATLCNATKFEGYLEAARTGEKGRGEWEDHDDEPVKTPF